MLSPSLYSTMNAMAVTKLCQPRRWMYSRKGSRTAAFRLLTGRCSRTGSATDNDRPTPTAIKPAVIQNTTDQAILSASIRDREPGIRLEMR